MRSSSTLGWRLFSTFFFPFALLVFTFALYWRLFSLPFFWDDAPHFLDFTQHSLWEIWTNQTGYGYYRPLIFSFFKISYHRWQWPPHYFYAVELIFHWLNGLLIAQLVHRLQVAGCRLQVADVRSPLATARLSSPNARHSPLATRHSPLSTARLISPNACHYAWAAALLFLTYPFSAVALGNVAAMMHPIVTCLALLAMVTSLEYLQNPHTKRWLLIAASATFSAPFVHEYGVTVGAIVALGIVLYEGWGDWQRRGLILLFPFLNLLFVPLWLLAPKSSRGIGWVGWQSLGSSITFFVQGLTYIFQPLSQRLIQRGTPELGTIWAIALPCLLLASLLLWKRGQWRLLLFALGWFILSILPSVIGLPFSYIYPSMRLHYFPGVAGVLLMSAAGISLAQSLPSTRLRSLAAWGITLLGMALPTLFIQSNLRLHQFALSPVWQMAEIVRQHPAEKHLLINPIDWIAYRRIWYPLGHEGVEVMPGYVIPAHLASINARLPAHIQGVVFPTLSTTLDNYHYGLNGEEWWARDWEGIATMSLAADRVWLMQYAPSGITIEEAGTLKSGNALTPTHYLANFEGRLFLRASEAKLEDKLEDKADEQLDRQFGRQFDRQFGRQLEERGVPTMRITLDWKYLGPDPDATVFRHLLDCAGNVLGQGDGYVLGRALSFAVTAPGAEIRDVRHIPLSARSADGCYRLEVGLFRADGQRVKVFTPQGEAFENSLVPIRVNGG